MVALLGPLAALGTAFCWSFTAILFSYSGRIIGSGIVNRSRLIFALVFISASHLLLEGSLFPVDAAPFRWGWLGLSSVLGLVLGDTFLFRAYVMIGPRLSMLMMSSVPIISTLLAWLFLGERVSLVEWGGILLTVGGIAWVVTERQQGLTVVENKHYSSGLFYGFLGALGQASNLVAAKFGLVDGFPTISATAIRILVALLILWAAAGYRRQARATLRAWRSRQAFPAMIGGTITGPFLGIWLSLVAIQLTRVGIASTIMALPPVILIPLGRLIYGEQVSARGITGTMVAFAGVALIFLPR
ncbi:MAG: DMT family transporter [Candidatus Promineifilaceae bacterium]|nr:DMT family transporter [Candidatus Promineifilaceae bacterium]